jgi:serine/threonine protein kinase
MDFGAGKEISLTTSHRNGVMGAICYLDPQRCGTYKLRKLSDIYSLGVIFWQVFSGRKLFQRQKKGLINKVSGIFLIKY